MFSDWIGRRVKIAHLDHLQFLLAFAGRLPIGRVPQGQVTHVESVDDGDSDVWVHIDGLDVEYAFAPSQLELLPGPGL
jgi:hypothetical protein